MIGGRYQQKLPLGEGGAATVWLCDDTVAHTQVAIKFFPALSSSAEEFRREAAALIRHRHPNLVRLLDVGVENSEYPWLALEYVPGVDARTLLERDLPSPEDALRICAAVFLALDAMHRAGVAHGDVKPENVRIQGSTIKLIDFGRARLHHLFSQYRVFPGTPPYMHPNLFHGGSPDARSDCFATWVMAYELLQGVRPYTSTTLQSRTLPPPLPVSEAQYQPLIQAGLDGRLADARTSWLAITRALRGHFDLPLAPPPRPEPDAALMARLRDRLGARQSLAVVGDPELARGVLERVDRIASGNGRVLWSRDVWGERGVPLAGALGLVAYAAEVLRDPELQEVAAALGPLAGVLSAAQPAARAWLGPPATLSVRPVAEQLVVALQRFIAACPQPLLILADRVDRMDGASRRFLSTLVASGDAQVIGSAAPGSPHGLPHEERVEAGLSPPELGPLSPAHATLLAQARVLELPLGSLLSAATGVAEAEVEDAALACEAAREALWTGVEVIPRPGGGAQPEQARAWLREAATRLSLAEHPLLVARFALSAGDPALLPQVIDAAAEEAIHRDPRFALELLEQDPRPPTGARWLRQLQAALLAREMGRAASALAQIRASVELSVADQAEAEAEFQFRQGQTVPALHALQRAASALGSPVEGGLSGQLRSVMALLRMAMGRTPAPAPDAQLARVFERLHDLFFLHDNAPMLYIQQRWRQVAPRAARARAMEVVWLTALSRYTEAEQVERELFDEVREEVDPVGTAMVLMHRGMARVWRGRTVEAFADGVDATERLVKVGDPYLAALAATVMWTAGFHLASAGTMARINQEVEALVRITGDQRAMSWLRGGDGVLHWLAGDLDAALHSSQQWAQEAHQRQESSEALAWRYIGDLRLERGDWQGAAESLEMCMGAIRRYHVQMDFTDAVAISWLVADAQARLRNKSGLKVRWWWQRKLDALVRRSPRWGPRASAARAWQQAAAGDIEGARARFAQAAADAHTRQQHHDVWWVLTQQAMAIGDLGAIDAAEEIAATFGLKRGSERGR